MLVLVKVRNSPHKRLADRSRSSSACFEVPRHHSSLVIQWFRLDVQKLAEMILHWTYKISASCRFRKADIGPPLPWRIRVPLSFLTSQQFSQQQNGAPKWSTYFTISLGHCSERWSRWTLEQCVTWGPFTAMIEANRFRNRRSARST